jgi:hypothetical protein
MVPVWDAERDIIRKVAVSATNLVPNMGQFLPPSVNGAFWGTKMAPLMRHNFGCCPFCPFGAPFGNYLFHPADLLSLSNIHYLAILYHVARRMGLTSQLQSICSWPDSPEWWPLSGRNIGRIG